MLQHPGSYSADVDVKTPYLLPQAKLLSSSNVTLPCRSGQPKRAKLRRNSSASGVAALAAAGPRDSVLLPTPRHARSDSPHADLGPQWLNPQKPNNRWRRLGGVPGIAATVGAKAWPSAPIETIDGRASRAITFPFGLRRQTSWKLKDVALAGPGWAGSF